jgi:tRNA 2-thiouridine synthesizing protein A
MGESMSEKIDVRGLSCPQPVIETQKKMTQMSGGSLEVYVDTGTARDNVSRMAKKRGWTVVVNEAPDGFIVSLSK